jgi:superfamily I DNA/RNA helicase
LNNTDTLRDAILSQHPTEQQRNAIFAEELEFLLRAAPGSGKTWTSCRRFIWRGANWPYRVGGLALLSFTNAAIREFRTATKDVGRRDLLSDPNFVGTFDSFVERYIISPFGHLICGSSKRPRLFLGPRPGDWKNKNLLIWIDGRGGKKIPIPVWEIIPYPDGTKIRFKTSNNYGNTPVTIQCTNQLHYLLSLGYYTHAQRVYWACKLLFDRPHIANLLAKRFPEIIVDEAQDSNAWLLVLLNFIRGMGAKITLIGDPDQCIYEFSMADATSLPNLKKKWDIPERPLSRSFRCNNQIANAVRKIGGNPDFIGCKNGICKWHQAYIVKESSERFSDSISIFIKLLEQSNLTINSAAILCRAHTQLESIRGKVNYSNLRGKTKELAIASFLRDARHDFKEASQIVTVVLRNLTGDNPLWEQMDDSPESPVSMSAKLSIWRFTKDKNRLPPITQLGIQWIDIVRKQLDILIKELEIENDINLNRHINRTGLEDNQINLPLFEINNDFPAIRQDTIHQVKGESIDAVLVIGSSRFWNSVISAVNNEENSEDRRLAYVAMTRARHLLVIGIPQNHFNQHSKKWESWGFQVSK